MENLINSKSLNYWRTKRGLSQKELADKSKVSIRTINKLENSSEKAAQKVHEKVFRQLKNTLNCSSRDLSSEFTNNKATSLQKNKSKNDHHIMMKDIAKKLHKLSSIKVNQTTLANLEHVGKLYNTSLEEIIDMAAALFVDFAEKCLEKENENFSKDNLYYLLTKFTDSHHLEHQYDKKYEEIFKDYIWDSENFREDSEEFTMVKDVSHQIDGAIQERDVFFKKVSIPRELMDAHPDAYLPNQRQYNPINNQLDKLLKTRKMKEIFIHDDRRDKWNVIDDSSPYITFSNKSNVIFYMSDKDTHKDIKKKEKYGSIANDTKKHL